jgi:hypothetical protein
VLLALGLAGLLASACGSREQYFPVRGVVFYDDKPAPGAVVFLNPAGGKKKDEMLPMGTVSADGTFVIMTGEEEGARPGEYVATVVWKSPSKQGDGDEVNLVPPRYMSPSTSELRVTVVAGPNQLEPFNLYP